MTIDQTRADRRAQAVRETIEAVRAINARHGESREMLEHVKPVLVALASRTDLFPAQSFGNLPGRAGTIFHLAEDPDGRFALYGSAGAIGKKQPPHNHTTWAVIVGVSGEEVNRFYDRTPDNGVKEKGESHVVCQGTGVSFMPDDLHSIHIKAPLVNFHMYGLGL